MILKDEIKTIATATVWRILRQQPLHQYKTKLNNLVSAGEPLNPEIINEVRNAWGVSIREGYGQTEITALIGYCLGQNIVPGTMRNPLPGYQIKVVDEMGNEATQGELTVGLTPRPVGLMTGYINDPKKTEAVMSPPGYRTGDTVIYNGQSFFFQGRTDDMIKSSGYRISPFELESHVMECPEVAEVAVIGKPDAIKGKVPKAFIVLRQRVLPTVALKEKILNDMLCFDAISLLQRFHGKH